MSRPWLIPLSGALCASALVLAAPGGHAESKPARFAVATENVVSTREGLAELSAGGNAVDAIVRAALTAGVVSPSSSGLGGGGFALVWRAATREPYVLDFRESAPAAIDVAAFEARPFKPEERARATGVPGELAGLWQLQHDLGKRPWRDVVLPAARVAETGFAVSQHLSNALASPWSKLAQTDAGLARLFFPSGTPIAAGKSLKNAQLARTLRELAQKGKAPLYEGQLGAQLIATAQGKGGALSLEDLRNYRPLTRQAIRVSWEGYDVFTMPPPSAGGLMVAEALGMFSQAELRRLGLGTGVFQHTLAEAMRGALSDRMRFLGDPDFERVDISALLDPQRLAARKRWISAERTQALPRFQENEHGTHHLLAIDAEGNVASLTTTVNNAFGAKLSVPESGIVLNDELDDFTKQKDVAAFGLSQSPNRPRPGARPVSSMTPTLVVKDGKVVFALGGSGGQLIATNVTQLLLQRLAFGLSPQALLKLPRFAVPTSGPSLLLEAGAEKPLLDDLAWRGEVTEIMKQNATAVQIIAVDEGGVSAAADARKFGSALAK
ncbi:MAG TPA: gamma-glutamyltransferase [Polyangiaceae bacterium]|nr:gamma-glutamyltransferase [Polyangiaceae bacterium]HYQ28114.1 gamma-glutamyltransferase [Polyangiaceae bacterium]